MGGWCWCWCCCCWWFINSLSGGGGDGDGGGGGGGGGGGSGSSCTILDKIMEPVGTICNPLNRDVCCDTTHIVSLLIICSRAF